MVLIREEYLNKYPNEADIPPDLVDRFNFLEKTVSGALNRAYALGWRQTDGEETPPASATASR